MIRSSDQPGTADASRRCSSETPADASNGNVVASQRQKHWRTRLRRLDAGRKRESRRALSGARRVGHGSCRGRGARSVGYGAARSAEARRARKKGEFSPQSSSSSNHFHESLTQLKREFGAGRWPGSSPFPLPRGLPAHPRAPRFRLHVDITLRTRHARPTALGDALRASRSRRRLPHLPCA